MDLKERSASQAHFLDLCALLGVADPVTADPKGEGYAFERGAQKAGGGDGWADVWKRGHFAWEYKGRKANLDAAFRQLLLYAGALENPPLLITSDMDRIVLTTNFQNYVATRHTILLDDLADADRRAMLRFAFTDPDRLRPGRTRAEATGEAAEAFAALADRLAARRVPAPEVARFVDRMVFCLFADDVGLLPAGLMDRMLAASERRPETFPASCAALFDAMASPGGGVVAFEQVEWFNGRLFDGGGPPPALTRDEIADLRAAAALDWSHIDPAIFGTLFERFLNSEKRGQLGAFYTDPAQIMQIVGPVVVAPLAAEWEAARAFIADRAGQARGTEPAGQARGTGPAGQVRGTGHAGQARGTGPAGTARGRKAAEARLAAMLERLRGVRVLDPACGSGNFLYMALQALKDLEKRIGIEAEAAGLQRPLMLGVGPANVLGIEKDPYAAELARIAIWIGEIQWMRRNGYAEARDPILKPLDTIECRDALLTPEGREAAWPAAECIVGNPPFLGDKMMRGAMGDAAVETLRKVYAGRLPGGADLVCYWFEKARAEIAAGRAQRAGLVATNSIRGGANRRVLDRIAEAGQQVFEAWSDEAWVQDSAAVRVSLVCFGVPPAGTRRLDGKEVQAINADLSGEGLDLTRAQRLRENANVCFIGRQKDGPIDIPGERARAFLLSSGNPHGRPNSDIVRPWINGLDVTRRGRDMWLVDFMELPEREAALYEQPFGYLEATLKPLRLTNRDHQRRTLWWRPGRSGSDLRRGLRTVSRYCATARVAKHRLFVWVDASVTPDCQVVAIARDDDATFGILHSRFHEAWALRLCTWLGVGNDPRYTPTTTFETFPFPEGLTPDLPPPDPATHAAAGAIAAAARRLHELREAWLNPPDLIRREPEVVPGFPDRLLPRDDRAAKELAKRTLTNLYNARPRWLADAHAALDAAVAGAYGWPADIAEDDALGRLLALNLARQAA